MSVTIWRGWGREERKEGGMDRIEGNREGNEGQRKKVVRKERTEEL